MSEVVIYTVSAIFLYFLADGILKFLESIHGAQIPYRSFVFFGIILSLALMLFQILKLVLQS
jgi:hypothetical protein